MAAQLRQKLTVKKKNYSQNCNFFPRILEYCEIIGLHFFKELALIVVLTNAMLLLS